MMKDECTTARPFVPAPGEAREAREPLDPRKLYYPHVRAAGRCRFIPGETAGPDTICCAEPVAHELTSYCREHHVRCHAPHTATGKGFSAGWEHKAAA